MIKAQTRSSMEISDEIAAVLERVSPNMYFPEEHSENTKTVHAFLMGRKLVTPRAFLSAIRLQAAEAGFSDEMTPLVGEARRFLNRIDPQTRHHRAGPER